jgi:hypothetical protein
MEWIATERLLDERLSGSVRNRRRYIKYATRAKDVPVEMPFLQALAAAAALETLSRGIPHATRVIDLVLRNGPDHRGKLVVFKGIGGSPEIHPADGFGVRSATVIELDPLEDLLRAPAP